MKFITIIERDQFDCDREFIIRQNEIGGVFLAEIDPDFDCETFLGVYDSKAAAVDRIKKLIR